MPNHRRAVHGEASINGDASGGLALVLYCSDNEVCELEEDGILEISHVSISQQKDSFYALVFDEDVVEQRIVRGKLPPEGTNYTVSFNPPIQCKMGVIPTYIGSNSGANGCIIQGHTT